MWKTIVSIKRINMLFNTSFVLASSSKSRHKILKNNNLVFLTKKPKCDEELIKKELKKNTTTPKKISLELARAKARSVSGKTKNKLVVGSDTVISLRGKIINKVKKTKDAKRKIKLLSGKKHSIFSSVSVFLNTQEVWSCTQKSIVTIRKLNHYEIDVYLKQCGNEILSSVGCYQAERLGPNIIKNIEGDFFNVMGFPLFPFLNFLNKYKTKQKK